MNKFNQPDNNNKNNRTPTGKPESANQQGNNKPKGEGKVEVGDPDAQDEQPKAQAKSQGDRKAS